jgi:hypothetical protein
MADALDRGREHFRQPLSACTFAFEHVVGHALRGLRANARQDAQCFDQLFEQ